MTNIEVKFENLWQTVRKSFVDVNIKIVIENAKIKRNLRIKLNVAKNECCPYTEMF